MTTSPDFPRRSGTHREVMMAPKFVASSWMLPLAAEYNSTGVPSGKLPNGRRRTEGAPLRDETKDVLTELREAMGAFRGILFALIDRTRMLVDEVNDLQALAMRRDEG